VIPSLKELARALGGEVTGGEVVAPGPGHSRKDRSLSVKLSASAPDGFLAFSHCGDDFAECRDYIRERIGLDPNGWKRPALEQKVKPRRPAPVESDNSARTRMALDIWRASVDPRSTIVEQYLKSRSLDLGDDIAGGVIRWHAGIGAMVALFRSIHTGEPQAISRTFIDREGKKLDRKFLGPTGGAAVMLDPFDSVLGGLHIGEGVETCLAGRHIGLKPAWALGSAGSIASFPVLGGVEALTLLREHDEANAKASDACARQWIDAGRDVFDAWPNGGKDINDAIKATESARG